MEDGLTFTAVAIETQFTVTLVAIFRLNATAAIVTRVERFALIFSCWMIIGLYINLH